MHLTRASLLLVLWACAGGDGGTDGSPTAPPDPAVELGTGETAFEELSDGDEVYVVHGPQGGYHIVGALRAWGIHHGNPDDLGDPDNPTTTFRVFLGGEQLDVGIQFVQGIKPVDGEPYTYEMIDRTVILDITSDAEVDGAEVEMEVEIADVDGNVVSDAHTLTVIPHPLN